jgi:hypothetical protein
MKIAYNAINRQPRLKTGAPQALSDERKKEGWIDE